MKNTKSGQVIKRLRETRMRIIHLILVSIILALAVNLLAMGINEFHFLPAWAYFVVSAVAFLLCFIGYKIHEIRTSRIFITFDGFFVYHQKSKYLIPIRSYLISEDMVRNMEAAFRENKGLEQIWNSNNLSEGQAGRNDTPAPPNPARVLLTELIQYCVLEKMSTYVVDYFNGSSAEKETERYEGDKLSGIILHNRFIKLFSEPIENRIAFTKTKISISERDGDGNSRIIQALSTEGALYTSFEFHLPKGTKVLQKDENTLEFNMRNFVISIGVHFDGYSTVLPKEFFRYYMGVPQEAERDLSEYKFQTEICVKQKMRSVFRHIKWAEYNWIDGLMDEFSEYIDMDTFFDAIQWKHLLGQIITQRNVAKSLVIRAKSPAPQKILPPQK